MTNKEDMMYRKTTLDELGDELTALEVEIARQRLVRERTTYRLEQLLRERDRLDRHVALLSQAQPMEAD